MNEETSISHVPTDMLSDIEIRHEYATTGQRFINYLIDNLLMRFGLSYATGIVIAYGIDAINPELLYSWQTSGFTGLLILSYLIAILNYVFYYTFCEKLFQGRTLGKLITGTMAIRTDGQPLTWRNAFLRSLCRLVPFEPLSGFGTPWHDSWTDTMVVKAR